ncbi:hypothetical protein [Streptomyces sp. CC208A]|nr:hypothetical protein [Streptomyces sp. CC208A]
MADTTPDGTGPTSTEEDRTAIQVDVDQLMDEIDRIGQQADFNKPQE